MCLQNIGYKCGRSKSIDCNFRYEDTSGLRFRRSRQIIRQIVQNYGFGQRCPHHTVNFWPTPDHNLKFKIWLKIAKLAFAVHNGHNGKVIMDFYLFFYSFFYFKWFVSISFLFFLMKNFLECQPIWLIILIMIAHFWWFSKIMHLFWLVWFPFLGWLGLMFPFPLHP